MCLVWKEIDCLNESTLEISEMIMKEDNESHQSQKEGEKKRERPIYLHSQNQRNITLILMVSS